MNSVFLLILALLTLLAFLEARDHSDKSFSKVKLNKDADNGQKVIKSPSLSKNRLRKKVMTGTYIKKKSNEPGKTKKGRTKRLRLKKKVRRRRKPAIITTKNEHSNKTGSVISETAIKYKVKKHQKPAITTTEDSNKTGSVISGTAIKYKCKGRGCRVKRKRRYNRGNSRRIRKRLKKTTISTQRSESTTQRTTSFTKRKKVKKNKYRELGPCTDNRQIYNKRLRSMACSKSGRFKIKQCNNIVGCICVNPMTGEEIPGPPIGHRNDGECMQRVRKYFDKLTKCQKESLEAVEDSLKGYMDSFGPQCTEDGLFRRKQWYPLSGTWCVDPTTGEEIPNTRSIGWEKNKHCPGE